MTECHQQLGRRTFNHHLKAHYPSRSCTNSNSVDQLHDVSDTKDEVARGDFSVHRSKEMLWTNCRETSVDLYRHAKDTCLNVTTRNTRDHDSEIEDVWTKPDTLAPRREIGSVGWRCQCKLYARRQFNLDLSRSSCDHYCDKCHYHRDYNQDYFHQNCHCQEHHTVRNVPINTKGCETHGCIVDRKAQHKSCHCDPMLDENSRLCEHHCCTKNSTIASGIRERNDEEHEEDDDEVAVINHKDSMCILAEKYKANRRYCDGNKIEARMEDRMGKDECNKSLTSEIIDQPDPLESVNAAPREGSSMKHVCHAHCMSCGTTIGKTCSRGRRYTTSENEFEQFKFPLKETTAHCCSKRTSYKCNF